MSRIRHQRLKVPSGVREFAQNNERIVTVLNLYTYILNNLLNVNCPFIIVIIVSEKSLDKFLIILLPNLI